MPVSLSFRGLETFTLRHRDINFMAFSRVKMKERYVKRGRAMGKEGRVTVLISLSV